MQETTNRAGLTILGAALVLGIVADGLLRAGPWGLNVVLFTMAILIAVLIIARYNRTTLTGGARWIAVPVVLFAAVWAWRDAPAVLAYSLLALLVTLALFAWRGRTGRLRIGGLVDYAIGIFVAGIYALFGVFVLLFSRLHWRELRKDLRLGRVAGGAARVAIGALIALPLLLIFGGLFAAADPNFDTLMRNLFNWDIERLLGHLFLAGFFAWLTAGFLHMVFLAQPVANGSISLPGNRIGIVEIATALGLLNALFVAFVVLQFRYLFGGASVLGYAEYARRGFFELVTVAALVLPVLLLAHWLVRKDNPSHARLFNLLAGALIVLLFVIMASAVQRMALYVTQYGLTELRLYTTTFMAWLALVFVWFILTVLRGRRDEFVFGALVAVIVVAVALTTLNPDDFIARANIAWTGRAAPGNEDPNPRARRALDSSYLASLSADAVPVLLDVLPQLPEQQRCETAAKILARWSPPKSPDWRIWNFSRVQAWRLVGEKMDYLQQVACPSQ